MDLGSREGRSGLRCRGIGHDGGQDGPGRPLSGVRPDGVATEGRTSAGMDDKTEEELEKHQVMSINVLDKVDATISIPHLGQLPEAINELSGTGPAGSLCRWHGQTNNPHGQNRG